MFFVIPGHKTFIYITGNCPIRMLLYSLRFTKIYNHKYLDYKTYVENCQIINIPKPLIFQNA